MRLHTRAALIAAVTSAALLTTGLPVAAQTPTADAAAAAARASSPPTPIAPDAPEPATPPTGAAEEAPVTDPSALPEASAAAAPPTIRNPITDSFSDSYADPSILRGKDGWYYLYATSDPLVAGGEFGLMHISRTRDFAEWEYLGTVFDDDTKPAWADEDSFFWAPDVRYLGGEYLMYYTVTDSAAKPGDDAGIGVASAPTPAGPWRDSGRPVVESRAIPDTDPVQYRGLIDPALFTDDDGRNYLYVGGFAGGLAVVELDATGRRTIGDLQQTAVSDRYEGSYVVKHDGYYYLMVSAAGCCSAVVSGYSVFAGRSESPRGPFVDREGVPMNQSQAGGTQVIAANGNTWVGVGHHAVITDVSGQDWMLYHGIDRDDGWLEEPGSINRRPTLIDRMDWIDGWPVVNAGAYASDGPITAPVTASAFGIDSDAPAAGSAFRGLGSTWRASTDRVGDAGAIAQLRPTRRVDAAALLRSSVRGEQRVTADVRLAGSGRGQGCVKLSGLRDGVAVCIDGNAHQLTLTSRSGGARDVQRVDIPRRIDLRDWLALTVELRAGGVYATVSESGLNDPAAEAVSTLARGDGAAALRLTATGPGADVDNVAVVPAFTPVIERVPDPAVGDVTYSQDFDSDLDDVLADGWQELGGPREESRERRSQSPDDGAVALRDPRSTATLGAPETIVPRAAPEDADEEGTGAYVSDGALEWPLRGDDLTGPDGTGANLVRDAPEGDWVAETKLRLDLGTDEVRNFQQAGLIVYENDDSFLRQSTLALGRARTIEFLKEIRFGDQTFSGGHLDGPADEVIWLRIRHTTNDAGEHLYRSASSIDGRTWRWGMVWTLPAGADTRIGLQAGGGADPEAAARFDYFRLRAAPYSLV